MRTHEIMVSGWKGGTGGFRVPKKHMRLFKKHRTWLTRHDLVVHLPGVCQPLKIRLSLSFWSTCHEMRSAEIGRWMRRRGEAPWPKNRPPTYQATLIVGPKIELKLRC